MGEKEPNGENIYINTESETYVISSKHVVKAEDEFLPLCTMCTKSRLTCENDFVREVEVPADNPDDEIIRRIRQPDGTYAEQRTGLKRVDGVKAGILKSEEEIPIPFVCNSFKPKDLG